MEVQTNRQGLKGWASQFPNRVRPGTLRGVHFRPDEDTAPPDLDMDAFNALSPDEQRHVLEHGQLPEQEPAAEAAAEAANPALEAAERPDQQQAEMPAAPEQPQQQRGNPDVPLRQARERLHQYESLLQDPQALRQYLAQIDPGEAPDFEEDPDAALSHRIAPLEQRLAALEQENRALKQDQMTRALHQELAGKHGADFHDTLSAFDQANPHPADLHPEVRYYAALGARAKNQPAAPTEEQIAQAAERKLAELLKAGQNPVRTLGSAPPAKADTPLPDIGTMSMDDFERMSPADRERLRRSM